eukprot:2513927-Rhodomonas_salina.1
MSAHGIAFSPKKRAEARLNEKGNDQSNEQAQISSETGKEDRKHANLDKKLHGKSAVGGNMAPDAKQDRDRSTRVMNDQVAFFVVRRFILLLCPEDLTPRLPQTGRRATTPTKDQLYGNSKKILGSNKREEEAPRKPAGSKLRAKSVQEFERVLSSWQPSQTIIPSPHRAPIETLELQSESTAEVLTLVGDAPTEEGAAGL